MAQENADRVLIAGAGPVGLTLAFMLAQKGVPVTVFEAEDELPEETRASGFHPPTLDFLEECGATAALLEMGLACPVMQYRGMKEGKIAELDYGLLKNDTRHPYRLQCEQYRLTLWLGAELPKQAGAELLLAHRVTGLVQHDNRVEAIIETPGGIRRIAGAYLIGSDGGRSIVRKSLGISFEGFTYPERVAVVGTSVDMRKAIPDLCSVNYIANARKPCSIFQNPRLWKVGISIPDDVPDEAAIAPDNIERQLQEIAPWPERYDTPQLGVYRVHQRIAATYRQGRVFLAGDAAHINNPFGGMGLNGGIHDAVNLARRLANVWHGKKPDSELDGYEAQRRPAAANAIAMQTDRNFRDLKETDRDARQRVMDGWRRLSSSRELAYQHMLQISMIGPLRETGMPDG